MKRELGFREMLARRQMKTGSLVMIGLDPLIEKLPSHLRTESPLNAHAATDVAIWMIAIVDKTAPFAAGYKVQRAHWEAIPGGVEAMQMVVSYIHQRYPDIPVFLDCKRGDIGRTQAQYKIAQLDIDGADGMNFSPYMGKDCLEHLVDKDVSRAGLVGLCYTSNPSAREVQDAVMEDGRTFWEFMAETILRWSTELGVVENVGLVMAAAYEYPKGSGQVYSKHLSRCREIISNLLWLLIPGVGTQGGFVAETVKAAYAGPGSMVISSSSDIIFASSGYDFDIAAGEKARQLYLECWQAQVALGYNPVMVEEALIDYRDPLATLKNCAGYYKSRVDGNGNFCGPLVGYAGQYETLEGKKNFVGFEYFNFSQVEQHPKVLDWFGANLAEKLKMYNVEGDVLIGAPMGGVRLAGSIGQHFGCRAIFAEKKPLPIREAEKDQKMKSVLVLGRHIISPGDQVVIVEDVCNNFSTTKELTDLIESNGGKVVAIACAFNRSGVNEWEGRPVVEAHFVPTQQFKQDDPVVAGLLAKNNIFWEAKTHWNLLMTAGME